MLKPRRNRPRLSKAQWTEILKRFESSGLGSREFCRREELAPSSFQRWRRQIGPVEAAEFVELVPSVSPREETSSWSLDVSLPNGMRLRFQG